MTRYEEKLQRVQWLEKQAQRKDMEKRVRREFLSSAKRERRALERMTITEAFTPANKTPFYGEL